ncbi:MAG: DegT/DnrJ/EryC1/StrS family aminotransferase [Clostridia bacterium]|nr:DegT/DnrJ/EryC1/StrS family aminotransferase [Clostridia bacterium]
MANLALLGGEKTVTLDYEKVGNLPIVGAKAKAAVNEVMDRDEISLSPIVQEFEKKFCKYVGAEYGICLSNGTSCLQAALFGCGVGPGDEVIVPSYTFWASAAPIVATNAVPVFCEVNPDTHCIDPVDVEKRITKKTKAIMCVHVWGNPCDMDAIMAIAKKYDLKVVEDCSHAHGAMYKGKKVGTIGDVGCFSLQGSKILVAGEGGILVTNNREYYERATALGSYERLGSLPDDSNYKQYALTGMGHKFRPHPLGIAIANAQLDELDERNAVRNGNAKYFEELIADIDFIKIQDTYENCEKMYSYHYARYDHEKFGGIRLVTLLKALAAEGVTCGLCGYGRLHQAPLFTKGDVFGKGCPVKCPYADENRTSEGLELPVTEYLADASFMLAPRFEQPCKELIEQFSAAYHKVAANLDELKAYEVEHEEELKNYKPKSGRSINIFR